MPSVTSRKRRPATLRDYHLWRVLLWGVLVIGPAFIFEGLRGNYRDRPSLRWPAVTGTVMQSERRYHGGKHSYYSVGMTYSYLINDRRYMGHTIKLWNPDLRGDKETVKAFMAEHPVRSEVQVYYDPNDPRNAVLIPGADEAGNRLDLWCGGIITL